MIYNLFNWKPYAIKVLQHLLAEQQQWPSWLYQIRHGETESNRSRDELKKDPEILKLAKLFRRDIEAAIQDEELEWLNLENDALTLETVYDWRSEELKQQLKKVIRMATKFQGNNDRDIHLTELGFQQAVATGRGFGEKVERGEIEFPSVAYRSEYVRTGETWEGLVAGYPRLARLNPKMKKELNERDHGLAGLLRIREVYLSIDYIYALLWAIRGKRDYMPRGGASDTGFSLQTKGFHTIMNRSWAGHPVLVVSHSVTVESITASLANWTYEYRQKMPSPKNCSLTWFEFDPLLDGGKLQLVKYNELLYDPQALQAQYG